MKTQRKYGDTHADGQVFVFGSNLLGMHGGGAAAYALKNCGAIWGQGEGLQGSSYALPTKASYEQSLTVEQLYDHVMTFIDYATVHPEMEFFVTRVGCGLAGFTDEEVGPMFAATPSNCVLPTAWEKYPGGILCGV